VGVPGTKDLFRKESTCNFVIRAGEYDLEEMWIANAQSEHEKDLF
jgi:hypothetical protein